MNHHLVRGILALACAGQPILCQQPAANPRAGHNTDAVQPRPLPQPISSLLAPTGFDNRTLFAAAAGPLALVDFETLPSGTVLTNQLVPLGIAGCTGSSPFATAPVQQVVTASTSMLFPMFNTGTLPSEPSFLSNDMAAPVYATGEITVQFVAPVFAVGAFVADQGPLGNFQIEVFLFGTSQGAISVAPRTLPSSFVGILSPVPFTEARFSSLGNGDSWGLDNLEFGGCSPAYAVQVADSGGRNAPNSIAESPAGTRPQLGNSSFAVAIAQPGNACGLTNNAVVGYALSAAPASVLFGGFGCGAGVAGEVMIDPTASMTLVGLRPWFGTPAVFPLPIPGAPSLCGLFVPSQGFWIDAQSVSGPVVLSWRLDLVLGS